MSSDIESAIDAEEAPGQSNPFQRNVSGRISQLVTFWEEHRLAESVGVYSGLLHRIREASMDSPTISSLNALNRL